MGHGVQESLLAGGGSDAAQSKAVVMLLQEARATRHYMLYLVAFVIVQTPGFVYRMYQLYDVDGFRHHSALEYTLYLLQAVTQPSQGFFTCLLYSYNRNFFQQGASYPTPSKRSFSTVLPASTGLEREGGQEGHPRLAAHELADLQAQIMSINEQAPKHTARKEGDCPDPRPSTLAPGPTASAGQRRYAQWNAQGGDYPEHPSPGAFQRETAQADGCWRDVAAVVTARAG